MTTSSVAPSAGTGLGVGSCANVDLLLPVRISETQFYAVICADDAAAAEGALGSQVVSG